jgi:hypothetical protein
MRITITNWDRFQHYRNRRPPWVKIHQSLLTNRQWFSLSPDASKLLVECWLIASEEEPGVIDKELGDLAFRLRREEASMMASLEELVAQGFIETDSTVLAPRQQSASPETETEGETDKRQRQRRSPAYTDEFEQVWILHRRGGKAVAFEAFKEALRDGVSHEQIVDGLKGYVGSLGDGFRGCSLKRWITESRWEEDTDTGNKRAKTRSIVLTNWTPPALGDVG